MSSTLSLFRRDPFFAEFDSLVRNTLSPTAAPSIAFTPAAETVRDGDDVLVRLEVPGVDVGKDVSVEVTGGRLVVKGERRDERQEGEGGRSLREIRYGSFQRSFTLPSHVGADSVSASYDAGVLSIRVTGVYAGTEPTKITIDAAPKAVEAEQLGDES